MTPQEVLNRAADHIERYGLEKGHWIPDKFASGSGPTTTECPACTGGALALAVSRGREFSPNFILRPSEKRTLDEAIDMLARFIPEDIQGVTPLDRVIEWSDRSTQAHVVATLRAAAAG